MVVQRKEMLVSAALLAVHIPYIIYCSVDSSGHYEADTALKCLA